MRRQFNILAERSRRLAIEQPTKFALINMTNRWRFAYSKQLAVGPYPTYG